MGVVDALVIEAVGEVVVADGAAEAVVADDAADSLIELVSVDVVSVLTLEMEFVSSTVVVRDTTGDAGLAAAFSSTTSSAGRRRSDGNAVYAI